MNRFLQLFRLGNCLMGVVGLVVAAFIAAGPEMMDYWEDLAVASFSVLTFIAGGNSLNDFIDRGVDAFAHPERPIPSGRMMPDTAIKTASVMFIISITISMLLGLNAAVIIVFSILLMMAYEFRFKSTGIMGNVIIAVLTGLLFILGGVVVGGVWNTVAIAGMAGLVTVGREITKDIEDMEGDFNRRTLPKRIGARNAGIVAASCYVAGVLLSMQPVLMGMLNQLYLVVVLVADGMFIYCALILFQDPHRGQKLAKAGMLVALIAFIFGGLG